MYRKYGIALVLLVIGLVLAGPTVMGQNSDQQLAVHYYQSGEYDKAALYFEKLYARTPEKFYEQYVTCLVAMKDFKGAEKLSKKQIRRHPEDLTLLVDLGSIYRMQENEAKGKQTYDKAIKSLPDRSTQITRLAKAFTEIGEKEYALATYKRGRKLMGGDYLFNIEIAQVYGDMGRTDDMIREYLDLLEVKPNYIQSVQNMLARTVGFEEETPTNQALKASLLKRAQRSPEATIYAEMLIWMFVQEKNFGQAYTQTKALDRRKKEDGFRLLELARICESNQEYDVAIKCYRYVIGKGERNYYYIESKMNLLRVGQTKVTETGDYTREDLLELEKEYFSTLKELGRNGETAMLMKDLAHLEAFYLHQPDTAVSILEEAIDMPRISRNDQARCKLELGDILVIKNEIWDASLYYGQVDKDFKHDILAQEAKFRNAKVFYYTGDFRWAKAQLDVLKGSTSKLIANDALSLSLLITDNTGIDTTENTLRMFARADLLILQNKEKEAIAVLDSLVDQYPYHSLEDEILFRKYEIAMNNRDYEVAQEHLVSLLERFSTDILADEALFFLAELHHYQFKDLEKAKELYQSLLVEHPDSLYVVEARKRFRILRGDNIN